MDEVRCGADVFPQATRAGGKVLLIGMGTPVQTLPLSAAALREVDLLGVFRYADTYPRGIEVLSAERAAAAPDFSKLVTHRFEGLEAVSQAFGMAARTRDDASRLVLKVVVMMNDDDDRAWLP